MRFDSLSMYAEQASPVFDRLLFNGRRRFGDQMLLTRKDGIRATVKAMKSGRPFYYLPDLNARRRGVDLRALLRYSDRHDHRAFTSPAPLAPRY